MAIKTEDIVDVEALNRSTEQLRQRILTCSGWPDEMVRESQILLNLPPMFTRPTAIWDELEADVDVNAVMGGPELWQRVRNGEQGYTKHEVFMIYTMLGQTPPEL